MPCLGFVFSSSSKAGDSRSIVSGKWQTGHLGCGDSHKRCFTSTKQISHRNVLADGVKVLPDALAVEDVPTLRLDRVLCNIVAKSAHGSFADIFSRKGFGVGLTLQHQVRMTSHLSHARKSRSSGQYRHECKDIENSQGKDVGIVFPVNY